MARPLPRHRTRVSLARLIDEAIESLFNDAH
jgi:hypothetical protein